ncbi:hypothetical protein [Paracoccus sp. Z118]|uniref:hypothetical protein n=1 Tax=Paracoccus sp. Z118 TaxID=2851017 RepID=UPI002739B780|nr:hypothetical protein [Paracoccus sp. Z118]
MLAGVRARCRSASTPLLCAWDTTVCGRPSIAPERLIRASLIQILCSIGSEIADLGHDRHGGRSG